jgi:predicted MFS family arabinose efflux permease
MTSERTNWAGVGFGLALAVFVALQHYKLPPMLPTMLADYHYDRVLAGGLMSVYALSGLLLSITAGRWLHADGARFAIVAIAVLFVAGNLIGLAGAANGIVMLFSRGLEGIAFTLGAVMGPAIATVHASPRHRPLVIGMMAAWIPTGQLIASALTPVALSLGGWQPLWILTALMALAILAWGRLGDRNAYLKPEPAMSDGQPRHFSASELVRLRLGGGLFMLWSGQYAGLMTWLPPYLVEMHGFAEANAAAGYSLPVAVLLAFNVLTGLFLRWGASLSWLIAGATASQALFWWLAPFAGPGIDGVLLLLFYGIGAGITPTCLFALPSAIVGARRTAGAFGIIMTGRNIGVFLGPIAFAQATIWFAGGPQNEAGWTGAIVAFAVITSLAALIAALLAIRLARPGQGTSL